MSIYEASITNPKKQLEFYKQLSEQLQQENQQLKMIIKEYERLNKVNNRGFKITNVKKYDIDELLSYKKYKDNWNKLKKDLELVVDYGLGDESSKWDKIYGEYAKSTLKFMQELQGSDSNE